MKQRPLIHAALLALLLSAGCASMFTSKTNVTVEVLPDKTCRATYASDKEQQGLEASICGGMVKVDKSGTLAEVVAATLQTQVMLNQLIQSLAAGAKTGALSGS